MSGGGDSHALLRLLADLRAARGFDLYAAHFDHGLREGSRREARRVADMARAAGVPCRVVRAAGLEGGQEAWRVARYRFLDREADRIGADRIALAHQADDQIETVLFRLLRGTGVRGLRGIPVRRGRYVRPLLGFRREELRTELIRRGLGWIEDDSNLDARFARPRIRHGLLPALRVAGEGAETVLAGLALDASTVDRGLDRLASRKLREAREQGTDGLPGAQIARPGAADYDRAVLARILRKLARERGFRLSRGGTRSGVEFIRRGRSGGSVDVGGGLRLRREFDRLVLAPVSPPPEDRELVIASTASGSGTVELDGASYAVSWGREGGEPGGWRAEIDASRVRFPLRVRGPRPGDRIRMHGGSRKVKKLLNERRVPLSERGRVPVLEGADGRILWVAGHTVRAGMAPGAEGGLRVEIGGR